MEYELKRSKRATAMRLAVHPDGAVVVTAPTYFGIRVIEYFLQKHAAWVKRKQDVVKGTTVIRIARKDIPMLKQQALARATERCEQYARIYGVSFGKISIRAQKARWGSCSKSGNLSFNFRIAALPERLFEYVIVHEICHLLELNHSPAFWKQVEKCVPEHKQLRKKMRTCVVLAS